MRDSIGYIHVIVKIDGQEETQLCSTSKADEESNGWDLIIRLCIGTTLTHGGPHMDKTKHLKFNNPQWGPRGADDNMLAQQPCPLGGPHQKPEQTPKAREIWTLLRAEL